MKNFQKLFKGRLGRLHYFLGNLIILGIGLLIVMMYPSTYLSFLFTLLTLPISVRRLHDIGLPGYLAPIGWGSYFADSYFGGVLFIVAVIFNLFLYFKGGDNKPNEYGNKPKSGIKFIDAILNKDIIDDEENESTDGQKLGGV